MSIPKLLRRRGSPRVEKPVSLLNLLDGKTPAARKALARKAAEAHRRELIQALKIYELIASLRDRDAQPHTLKPS